MIKHFFYILPTCIFLLLTSFAYAEKITGKVVKVTDGDTVHILLKSMQKEKIRLAGIDAPERKQAFGKKSKQYLADLIGAKQVTVEFDKRDRYGRIVGKLHYKGKDINLEMVKAGFAWHYKKYAHEQNEDDRIAYVVAENNAYRNKKGLWYGNLPISPWEYREKRRKKKKILNQ